MSLPRFFFHTKVHVSSHPASRVAPSSDALPSRTTFPLIVFLVLLLSWFTFSDLIGVRFTNPDDSVFSILPWNHYLAIAGHDAVVTGRFAMYYTWLYYLLTPAFWDTPLLDIAMYGSVTAVILAIVTLSRHLGCKRSGLLFAALYFAFIPVTYDFNLLVSYPLRYTPALILIVLAIAEIENFLRTARARHLYVACACSFIASLHHETLFAVAASSTLTFAILRQREGSVLQRAAHPIVRWLFGTSAAYAAIFVAWYATHLPTYEGNTINLNSAHYVVDYATAAQYFVVSALPLFQFLHGYALSFIFGGTNQYASMTIGRDFDSIIANLGAPVLARAVVVGSSVFVAASRLPERLNKPGLTTAITIAFGILLLPAAIISLSATYQGYVRGGYAPLHVVFFSYFGATILLTSIALSVVVVLPREYRLIAVTALSALVGLGSIVSATFNSQVATIMQANSARWVVASMVMRHFEQAPAQAVPGTIVAPQLWDYSGQPGPLPKNYWQQLFREKAGLTVQFVPRAVRGAREASALYFDCSTPKDCIALLLDGGTGATTVLTQSPMPRFLSYAGPRGAEIVRVVPTAELRPTLLQPALFVVRLPAKYRDIAHWQIEM
jgi:hypothetical protein